MHKTILLGIAVTIISIVAFLNHDVYAVGSDIMDKSPIPTQSFQTMFSDSLNYDRSNTDQDPMHRFSITRPQYWFVKDEPWVDDPHLMSTFWNRNFDHSVFLLIFRNDSGKSVDWNSLTDKEIRDTVSSYLNEQHVNASETSITHYSDGLKIISVGLVIDEQGRPDSKQKITTYWFNSGLRYDVKYIADPADFDQYLDAVQKSIDTFYVSEKLSQITSSGESVIPEFSSMVGIIITTSIIGSLVISRRFFKI